MATPNLDRRTSLERWFGELWQYWRGFLEEEELSDEQADSLARSLKRSEFLRVIPQISNKELIADAIACGCAFCTRDRKTILKYRDKLRKSLCVSFHLPSGGPWSSPMHHYGSDYRSYVGRDIGIFFPGGKPAILDTIGFIPGGAHGEA